VTGQTYPRKQDYQVLSALAGLGGSLNKFAFDLRLLQSPAIGEVAEPFGTRQVGSSAMPFKRNPIGAERIDSLARQLAQMPRLAWDNAAHSLLERTLDDSANRRSLLPEAFLICDELLLTAERIVAGLQMDVTAVQRNLSEFGPFAATERVLAAAGKAGADRQIIHERLRKHSLAAWESLQAGGQNLLVERLCLDEELLKYLSESEIRSLMHVGGHIGDAVERARSLAQNLREAVTAEKS
jgi:adenylosuccinate lyase